MEQLLTFVFVMNSVFIYVLFPGVALASVGVTATTVSVTPAVSMAPVNSPGSVTARRVGVGSSATRVSLDPPPEI